ncbi:hypothetical protein [Kinneretia aquatilis]|uniref:hypothetical protein n=1 Tax=Kinneretia aquatilis TaxID=2070761 RepID=UPI0010575011|nr:hypothetical protein [Paucibacter aquatile]
MKKLSLAAAIGIASISSHASTTPDLPLTVHYGCVPKSGVIAVDVDELSNPKLAPEGMAPIYLSEVAESADTTEGTSPAPTSGRGIENAALPIEKQCQIGSAAYKVIFSTKLVNRELGRIRRNFFVTIQRNGEVVASAVRLGVCVAKSKKFNSDCAVKIRVFDLGKEVFVEFTYASSSSKWLRPNHSLNRTRNSMPPTGHISFWPFGVLPSRAG